MTLQASTSSTVSEPAFHSDDLPEVAEYRSMSALAIVAFIFGLASPLCFWAPLLMGIPLFGTALALVALRRIATSDGALAGRGVALAGLVLCLVSVTASISHDRLKRHLRANQAEELARHWIGLLLAGKIEPAFRLTVDGTRPSAPPAPGEPAPKETPLEAFTNNRLVQKLRAAGPASNVDFVRTMSYRQVATGQVIVQQEYSVTPAATAGSGPQSPIAVVLELQRSRMAGEANLRWLVASYRDPNAPLDPDLGRQGLF